jgi:hypothetical protein
MMQYSQLQPSPESISTSDMSYRFDIKTPPSSTGLAPWYVSEWQFPTFRDVVEKLKYCVRYAILAPSLHTPAFRAELAH